MNHSDVMTLDRRPRHPRRPRCRWLDWSVPCLPAAAAWLIEQAADSDLAVVADLGSAVCVLPGRRAGRVLLQLLLEECHDRGRTLLPPAIVTPGSAIDLLFPATPASMPTATASEQLLAWTRTLRESEPELLQPILGSPPGPDDLLAWHDLARTIIALANELTGESLSFDRVADQAERMELMGEGDRWRALDALHRRYVAVLAEFGLIDPGEARAAAARDGRLNDGVDLVVLIGTVDLNATQRAAFERVGDRLVALVHAPQSLSQAFDEIGCIRPDAWEKVRIDVDDSRIMVADRPEDQAQAALWAIEQLDGRYSAEEITIELGDESLAGPMTRAGDWAGVPVRSAAGDRLARSGPFRLLMAAGQWLIERRFTPLAALLRHPDMEQWLLRRLRDENEAVASNWLGPLDRYLAGHLAEHPAGAWLGTVSDQAPLKAVLDAVNDLLAPLANAKRPIQEWPALFGALLGEVYGSLEVRSTNPAVAASVDACLMIRDALSGWATARPLLDSPIDASTAMQMALAAGGDEPIPQSLRAEQVEMLGWLELHLDPAPALIIAGVNDGSIPSAQVGDAFLPDQLRRALGLMHNGRRMARDAYLLWAMLSSRQSVTIIAGRRDARGDPLPPSRLLLACVDRKLPARISMLCDAKLAWSWPLPTGLPAASIETKFIVPPPPSPPDPERPPLESMRVTAFADYLACPYRFMLKHLLKLEAVTDDARELDPMQFGILAHDVLHALGSEPRMVKSTDEGQIESFLLDVLARIARERFGDDPPPAVRVQVARLGQRLRGAAARQAQLRAEGWQIEHCEWVFNDSNVLEIPGQKSIRLRGRIDRIDRNLATGVFRILDYKTSDSPKSPERQHHGAETISDEWQDLQLPLYHHLAGQRGISGVVELGYFALPRDPREAGVVTAGWSADHLAAAIEKARAVVVAIRAGEFKMAGDYSSTFDEFARICQKHVLRADDVSDDGDDGTGGGAE